MMEEKSRKWKLSEIMSEVLVTLKNSAIAILQGRFLLRLGASNYALHIILTFVMIAAVIWTSLMIDTSLAKVEKNKSRIKELQIQYYEQTFDVAAASRRSTVGESLKRLGSDVCEPEKPAIR